MDGRRRLVSRYPVLAYVVVTVAVSWTAWGIQFVQPDPMGPVGTLCFLVGGLGPLFAALVVARLSGTGDDFLARLTRWRTSPGWYLVASLGPILVLGGTVLLTQLASTGEFSYDGVRPLATLPGLVVSGILLGGLEEPGWRGFAQEHLQRRHSAFVASLLVGLVWIGWHTPLFLIPGTAQSSTPLLPFAVMGLGLAVVFAWAYNSAGRSLPVVILLHGAFNGALGWSGLIETGSGGEAMWIVAGAVSLVAIGVLVHSGPATLSSGAGSVANISADQSEVPR